ncbi:hypothetical protein P7K49_018787 [Saguinus oedipus]|uniref:Uncharacterized protein n=1 Tax=Saguinus oedipus TaxID=9490 RepID=A0ABQ9V723_SAGOE|nr:hypothetical protein P7K49_018787 [Saguinus oedipus]
MPGCPGEASVLDALTQRHLVQRTSASAGLGARGARLQRGPPSPTLPARFLRRRGPPPCPHPRLLPPGSSQVQRRSEEEALGFKEAAGGARSLGFLLAPAP